MARNKNKGRNKKQAEAAPAKEEEAAGSPSQAAERPMSGGTEMFEDLDAFNKLSESKKDADGLNSEGRPAAADDSNESADNTATGSTSYDEKDPFATPKPSPVPWKSGTEGGSLSIPVDGPGNNADTTDSAEGSSTQPRQSLRKKLLSPMVPDFGPRPGQSARSSRRPPSMVLQKGVDTLSEELATASVSARNVSGEKPIHEGPGAGKETGGQDEVKDGKLKKPEYNEGKRRDELLQRHMELLNYHDELMKYIGTVMGNFIDFGEGLGERLRERGDLDSETEAVIQPEAFDMRKAVAHLELEAVIEDTRGLITEYHNVSVEEIITAEKNEHEIKVELSERKSRNSEGANSDLIKDYMSRQVEKDGGMVQGYHVSNKFHDPEQQHLESANLLDPFRNLDEWSMDLGAASLGSKSKAGKAKSSNSKAPDEPLVDLDEDGSIDLNRISGGDGGMSNRASKPARKGDDSFSKKRASDEVSSASADVDSYGSKGGKTEIENTQQDVVKDALKEAESSNPSNRSSDTVPELARPKGKELTPAPKVENVVPRRRSMQAFYTAARLKRLSKAFYLPPAPTIKEEDEVEGGKREKVKEKEVKEVKVIEKQVAIKTQWRDLSLNLLLQKLKDQRLPWLNLFHFLRLGLYAFATFFKQFILHQVIGPPNHPNKPTLEPLPVPPVEDFITMAYHLSIFFLLLCGMAVRKERMLWLEANAETREFLIDLVHGTRSWPGRMVDLAWGLVKGYYGEVLQDVKFSWMVVKYQASDLPSWFGLDVLWVWLLDLTEGPRMVVLEEGKDMAHIVGDMASVQGLIVKQIFVNLFTLFRLPLLLQWSTIALRFALRFAQETGKEMAHLAGKMASGQGLIVKHALLRLFELLGLNLLFRVLSAAFGLVWHLPRLCIGLLGSPVWDQGSGFTGFGLAGLLVGICVITTGVLHLVELGYEVYHTRINVW